MRIKLVHNIKHGPTNATNCAFKARAHVVVNGQYNWRVGTSQMKDVYKNQSLMKRVDEQKFPDRRLGALPIKLSGVAIEFCTCDVFLEPLLALNAKRLTFQQKCNKISTCLERTLSFIGKQHILTENYIMKIRLVYRIK